MKKNYESMIIISPSLTDKQAQEENKKLLTFIEKHGGEIVETDDVGIRNLAYSIKKNTQGYYIVNYFKFDPSKISELENYYHINNLNIIRFNIIRK